MSLPRDHSMQRATEVLSAIAANTEGFFRQDPGAREKMLTLARQLTIALEKPSETVWRMGWTEVCHSLRSYETECQIAFSLPL